MKIVLIFILLLIINACNSNQPVINANQAYCLKNSEEAVSLAEKKWLEIYGVGINDKKPFIAKLINDSIWVVEGSLSNFKNGGVPYAEINAINCKFIKITHGK
jgi:NTF2 fold immunity protein